MTLLRPSCTCLGARLLQGWLLCSFIPLASCGDPPSSGPESPKESSGPHIPLPNDEPIIRVRLVRVDTRQRTVEVGTSGQVIHLRSGEVARELQGPVHIQHTGSHWIFGDSNPSDAWTGDGGLEVELTSKSPMLLRREGTSRHYAGTLHCVPVSGSDEQGWQLIEYIELEDYLPGVLSAELYAGWTRECYAAQCVAARSFACMRIAQRTNRTFDVTDGPSTQAYHGVVDDPEAHDAQARTSGMVLSWNNHLVPGYFSSCCGGRAATAVDAISPSPINAIPPLMGHQDDDYCQNSPLYSWTINRSARSLGRRLASFARSRDHSDLESISSIEHISVAEANEHGRPVSLEVVDRNGHHATVTTDIFFRAANHSGSTGRPTKEIWSGWAIGDVKRGRIELQGHGFGHGAGMCQYGAQAMGEKGHSWQDIISWYFPGVTMHRAW